MKNGSKRLYSFRVLKQCGALPSSLAKVYTTVVRPALEYAAPVWQNIPDFLSYKIESIQKRAMHIIFPLMNYKEALNALNLTTLCESPGRAIMGYHQGRGRTLCDAWHFFRIRIIRQNMSSHPV